MLFLVATPIGNLDDLSHRAVQVLRTVDLVLCEDTRHSRRLLDHYTIAKPRKSLHQHNEAKRCEKIISLLKQGGQIALISDAGTPGISDPGQRLVAKCHKERLGVTAIPGANAAICALTLSGFPSEQFHFIGFLPKQMGPRRERILAALCAQGTTIAYEAPERISASLTLLDELDPHCHVGVARELTKRFETFLSGTPREVAAQLTPRGEIVLLIEGQPDRISAWSQLSARDHVSHLVSTYGLSQMDAIKLAAKQRGVPKRTVYSDLI